jgi:integrase
MYHLLNALTRPNEIALRVSMEYGMRIGDVLRMPTYAAQKGYWSFKEEKTGKRRVVRLTHYLKTECLSIAGKVYVFEHRLDPYKHRTRQAVYKDLRRVADFYKCEGVSPHSCRKIYSVEQYKQSGGNLKRVQKLLNHSDEAVTVLYALADQLSSSKRAARR